MESGVEFQQADFEASRDDEQLGLDLAAAYRVNRWLRLRGGVEHGTRSSTDAGAEFDNTIVFIELNMALDRRLGRKSLGN